MHEINPEGALAETPPAASPSSGRGLNRPDAAADFEMELRLADVAGAAA